MYISIDVEEREYRTTMTNPISLFRNMDIIVSKNTEEIRRENGMNLWPLNVAY